MNIPIELSEQLTKNNVVLFCGMDLSASPGGLPTTAQLAQELAERAGLGHMNQMTLPEAAQRYRLTASYHSLINYLTDRIEPPRYQPLPVHHLIASLPCQSIVTTAWDRLLETGLRQANHSVIKVLDDSDVSYVSTDKSTLIKLHGSLERKQSLVMSEDDYYEIFRRRPEITKLVGHLFATKTVLFLGFDLAGSDFKRLYNEVERNLGKHKRRAYALQPHPDAYQVHYWLTKNVQIISAEPTTFLQTLRARLGAPTPLVLPPDSSASPSCAPPPPYTPAPFTAGGMNLERGLNAFSARPTDETRTKPTIAIITALPKEFAAMRVMLDNVQRSHVDSASQLYFKGEVPAENGGQHHTILALMSDMGTNPAAVLATRLLGNFSSIKHIIMVGIAGGVPHPEKPDEHVRLGDVVVSNRNGVVQYDFDKESIDWLIHRHPPRPPSARLLVAVKLLEANELLGESPWLPHIKRASPLRHAARPPQETDIFADSNDQTVTISHPDDPNRVAGQPRVFTGRIASANKLLKNPQKRDYLRDKFGVKAIEMEGSGIADATWNDSVGYLVVRGICDYCDSNKNDLWQGYAAVVAAAYTRALLESMPR